MQLFRKNRYLPKSAGLKNLHFHYKMKAQLQPRLPMALAVALCSSLTPLFNGLPSFVTTDLSKFLNHVEASAAHGENGGSSSWVTTWTAGLLPASHWTQGTV